MKINLLNRAQRSTYNFIKPSRLIDQIPNKTVDYNKLTQIPSTQVWPEIKSITEEIFTWLAK